MGTLQIIFFGLCAFFGSEQQPRTVIVFDVSKGENVHGHQVQEHAAFIYVHPGGVVKDETDWPCRDQACREFELDNRTLTISTITDAPLDVKGSYQHLVPHLETECPELPKGVDPKTLIPAAAANIVLTHGKLCAHKAKAGAVSSVYKVTTSGQTTIRGTRHDYADRVLVLEPNAIIEIRNEPVKPEIGNHFIAYYKKIAPNDACCTNLPFRKVKDDYNGCDLPKPAEERVSTVACSNSNYP